MFTVTDGIAPDWASHDGYRGGMTIPGAWRAAVNIADLLAGAPWDAYRNLANTDKPTQKIFPRPLLLEQPNPPEAGFNSYHSLVLDKLWHGNAISVIAARNGQGWPTAAIPVPADSVMVRRVTRYSDSPLPVGAIEYAVGNMRLSSQDVIHVKGPHRPGAVRGMGVLEAHFETLNLARAQQRQAQSVSNHGVPTGVLKSSNPDLTDVEAERLKAKWLANQSSRSIAVLNASTEFQPLSWNPEELQMVEARKFTLNELELIFGLPVGWLGGTDSSRKYSNMSQDDQHLFKHTLGGHLAAFEQTYSLAYPPRSITVRSDLDVVILRADRGTRYADYGVGLDKGFLTKDEVRELEGLPPMPEPEPAPLPPVQAQAEVGTPQPAAIEGGEAA